MAHLWLSNPVVSRLHLVAPPRGGLSSSAQRSRTARIFFSQGLSCQGRRKFDNKPELLCVRAAVVPSATPLATGNEEQDTILSPSDNSNEEEKRKMCEMYGFTQIGDPVPNDVTLKDIMDTLPKKVFEIDDTKAWKSVLISASSYALGLFLISKAPWYLLPLAWAWTGTAVTGFFVIGHDCAHKSFSKNKLLEDIVGTLAFLPLIYPYEPWRFKHDRHHAKTNMLSEDTAWHPVWEEEFESSTALRKAIVFGYGPFRPWMSIAHWLKWHFDLKKFRPNEIARVKISLACVFAFMAIGWPLIILKTGIVGWFKFWLMPWFGYHFWVKYQYVPAVSCVAVILIFFYLVWIYG